MPGDIASLRIYCQYGPHLHGFPDHYERTALIAFFLNPDMPRNPSILLIFLFFYKNGTSRNLLTDEIRHLTRFLFLHFP
jgi:hypothetical protein